MKTKCMLVWTCVFFNFITDIVGCNLKYLYLNVYVTMFQWCGRGRRRDRRKKRKRNSNSVISIKYTTSEDLMTVIMYKNVTGVIISVIVGREADLYRTRIGLILLPG